MKIVMNGRKNGKYNNLMEECIRFILYIVNLSQKSILFPVYISTINVHSKNNLLNVFKQQ